MKNNILFLSLLLLTIVLVLVASCQKDEIKPGCTDPDATNYGSDANTEDGTCQYARDKFLGSYSGTSECMTASDWDLNEILFSITEIDGNVNQVLVTFFHPEYGPIEWLAIVVESNLIIDSATNAPPGNSSYCGVSSSKAVLKLTGTGTLSGNNLSIPNFVYEVIDSHRDILMCTQNCHIEAIKN